MIDVSACCHAASAASGEHSADGRAAASRAHWPPESAPQHAKHSRVDARNAQRRAEQKRDEAVEALAQSPTMPRALAVARSLLSAFGGQGLPDVALARQLRRLRGLGVRVDELGHP